MSLLTDHRLGGNLLIVLLHYMICAIVCIYEVLCTLTFATILLVVVLNLEFVSMSSHDVYISGSTNSPTIPAELIHFRNVKTVYCLNEDILLEYALHAEVCYIHVSVLRLFNVHYLAVKSCSCQHGLASHVTPTLCVVRLF